LKNRFDGARPQADRAAVAGKPRAEATDIKKRIEDVFKRDAELEAQTIRVDVHDGRVTLEGHVKVWTDRQAAERAAWSAPGVTAVEDRITLA
jgi:osmotically-inducible protein OsmY